MSEYLSKFKQILFYKIAIIMNKLMGKKNIKLNYYTKTAIKVGRRMIDIKLL